VFDQTKAIVDLLTKNLREIRALGVKKIAIFGTPPRGCFPGMYSETLRKCDKTWNKASSTHNKLLKESLQILNKESNGAKFVYLDLYSAIESALFDENKGDLSLLFCIIKMRSSVLLSILKRHENIVLNQRCFNVVLICILSMPLDLRKTWKS